MKVPGYILATDSPGAPVPIRKYISMPSIEFTLDLPDDGIDDNDTKTSDVFLGDDDPTLPINDRNTRRDDQRGLMYPDPAKSISKYTELEYTDPLTGKKKKKYLKAVSTNKSTGETIYREDYSLDSFSIITTDDQ